MSKIGRFSPTAEPNFPPSAHENSTQADPRAARIYSYRAYGLGIVSALPLLSLRQQKISHRHVVIRFGKSGCYPAKPGGSQPFCFRVTDKEAYFFWPDVATFLMRNGTEIVVDRRPQADVGLISLFILGTGLGVLLHQRGLLILHASAVMVDRSVVAFLGGSGWGKSTMAGSLRTKGYTLVCDDVLAIEFSKKQRPLVRPGVPHLKLWPESLKSLGEDPGIWSKLHPSFAKRSLSLEDNNIRQRAIGLSRIYVLAEGSADRITPLSPQAAFVEVIRHLYFARVRGILEGKALSAHLRQVTTLCVSVPVRLLRRRFSLGALSQVAELVEKDIRFGA